jgi:glycerol-3-phosphate dehydrogenase
MLRRDGLLGGAEYFDAATDDSRRTLVNVLDAIALGSVVANHVALVRIGQAGENVRVARLEDALTGERLEGRARVIVNATGPWSDAVEQMQGGGGAAAVQGSKGAHISVPRDRVGNREAVVLLHPRDGRVMFALPANTHAIIGTTDTFSDVSPDEVRATEGDVAYLLEAANAFFPTAGLARRDVVAAWAGIRPLMPTAGPSVSASREHLVRSSSHGVRITGGKLTTYRVTASQAVTAAQRMLGRRLKRARTDKRGLPGGDVYTHQLKMITHPDTPRDSFRAHAIAAYGNASGSLLEMCERGPGAQPIVAGLPYRRGEMRFAMAHELACTLGDLLIRRTKIAFETSDNGRAAARGVLEYVASFAKWDAARRERELTRYDAEVARIFTIDP